jgi:intracellular sulfur oxidation DsrE/DsrF family protein
MRQTDKSTIASVWLIVFSLAIGGFAVAQQQTVNKVVFQVSDGDPGKWNLTLNNAHNLQQELGADKVVVEIVAYGPGVGMLKRDSAAGERVAQALRDGISVVACQNTMKAMQLTEAEMLPGIGYVPAGVVELMHKQQHGYAYIRP